MLCTAGFSSTWTFCSTDFVVLAGIVISVRRVNDFGNMAADSVALAEVRADITFCVELYARWDAPEAVVDVSSEGVVPLRNIPDVIGLVGRREGTAESRVLQGRDVHSVQGHTSRLYGSLARISQCYVGGQVGQPREVSSSVDGVQEGVVGCVVCSALRELNGCASL